VARAEASHNSNNMERHIAARCQQGHGASHNSMEHRTAVRWRQHHGSRLGTTRSV
jgi:hypothetical protein